MATVTSYTAARMAAIEAASVVSGSVVGDNLILTKYSGATINAGNVRGATGATGPSANVSNEAWHQVGAVGEPAFQNTWTSYASGWELARFQKDPSGIVRLKGLITNTAAVGSTTVIFTLPVGYRPTYRRVLELINLNGTTPTRVDIYPTGDVVLLTPVVINSLLSFEGVTFDTEQLSWPAGAVQPIPVVNALPGSPIDGQEIYYQNTAMATAGVVWHLRYRSAASGSYKWEYLGGGKLTTSVGGTNAYTSSSTSLAWNLAPASPTMAVPLAGDYEIDGKLDISVNTSVQIRADVRTSTSAGTGITPGDTGTVMQAFGSSNVGSWLMTGKMTGLAAATNLNVYFAQTGSSNTGSVVGQTINIRPIRVG